jgi:hypothetical protein
MDMNERTIALAHRWAETADERITRLIREAEEEALSEAKTILKELLLQAILERVREKLNKKPGSLSPGVPEMAPGAIATENSLGNETPTAPCEPWPDSQTTDEEQQIRHEIEALRQKIAENNQLLSEAKALRQETKDEGSRPPQEQADPSSECEETGRGCYVYAIIPGNGGEPAQGLPSEGIDRAYPVRVLPVQDIQAVVSEVSLREFGQQALKVNVENMAWLENQVRAHEQVIQAVLDNHTVVPMRFCSIYRDESDLRAFLELRQNDFAQALARLQGKQEWGVKVYYEGATLAQKVSQVSDRVRALEEEIEGKSSGAAYFVRRKLEGAVAEEVERVSDQYAQCAHERLSSHATDSAINRLHNKDLGGRTQEMVLNSAYLVAADLLAAFHVEVESLQREHGDLGFIYEITGPWPPYNFATVEFEECIVDE